MAIAGTKQRGLKLGDDAGGRGIGRVRVEPETGAGAAEEALVSTGEFAGATTATGEAGVA